MIGKQYCVWEESMHSQAMAAGKCDSFDNVAS